jgi:hypothetical protein
MSRNTSISRSVFLILTFGLASIKADAIDDILPGEWYAAPSSKMNLVSPLPMPAGITGLTAVMAAWSGGSYDSKRDRLIIWGGGHTDYAGNELYVFDIKTQKWSRLDNPSVNVGGDEQSGVYPDGRPRARHTYDYVQYVPAIDAFCTFGGSGLYPSGQTGTDKTHCFNFQTNAWELKGNAPTSGIGSVSGVDPETGIAWLQGGGNNGGFAEWNSATNTWKTHGIYAKGWFEYYSTAAAGRGKLLALGQGKLIQWDLKKPDAPAIDLATVGEAPPASINNSGFTFDTKRGWFVAWNGGTSVYVFEIGAKVWKKVTIAATNKVIPTEAAHTGTYGRFQYVASKDVYVGVNATGEDVYFFRLPTNVDLTIVPTVIKDQRLLSNNLVNGKLRVNFGQGFSALSLSQSFPVSLNQAISEPFSCTVSSLQKELYRAESRLTSSGNLDFQMDALSVNPPATPTGVYFLSIKRGNQVLLTRSLSQIH